MIVRVEWCICSDILQHSKLIRCHAAYVVSQSMYIVTKTAIYINSNANGIMIKSERVMQTHESWSQIIKLKAKDSLENRVLPETLLSSAARIQDVVHHPFHPLGGHSDRKVACPSLAHQPKK